MEYLIGVLLLAGGIIATVLGIQRKAKNEGNREGRREVADRYEKEQEAHEQVVQEHKDEVAGVDVDDKRQRLLDNARNRGERSE